MFRAEAVTHGDAPSLSKSADCVLACEAAALTRWLCSFGGWNSDFGSIRELSKENSHPEASHLAVWLVCIHVHSHRVLNTAELHGWQKTCHNYLHPVPTLVVFKLLNLPKVRAQILFYEDLFIFSLIVGMCACVRTHARMHTYVSIPMVIREGCQISWSWSKRQL